MKNKSKTKAFARTLAAQAKAMAQEKPPVVKLSGRLRNERCPCGSGLKAKKCCFRPKS